MTLGLSALALLHSFVTITVRGAELGFWIVVLDVGFFLGFSMAVLVARRTKLFGTWQGAMLSLVLALAALSLLIIAGTT